MPLPDHPLLFHGGCNCGPIRYKITVPPQSERPLNPLSDGKVTFPVILTDHCNDCRKATASILPTWICVPMPMMTCSVEPIFQSPDSSEKTEHWVPATEIFTLNANSNNWVKFYKSLENVTRSFCGRCGTNLTYAISPSMGERWPDMYDVLLGGIDLRDLREE